MSHSVRIHNTIKIGSTKKRTSIETKSIDTIIDALINETKCVIHLIDTSAYRSFKEENDEEKIDVSEINQIITDQHMELWRMMKRGDLIEDLSQSGYMSNGRYIVDKNNSNCDLDIVRCGLIVRDLDREIDKHGTILNSMCTITEFPLGYFDDNNLVVNDYLFPGELPKSIWKEEQSVVWLDTEKLNINEITKDDISHMVHKTRNYDIHYLYLIIEYEKVKYLLYGMYNDQYSKHDIKKIIETIINHLKTVRVFNSEKIDENVCRIASAEKIDSKNILNIL
jgi:hypothetical protein